MPRKASRPCVADADPAPGGAAAVDRAISLLGAFRSGERALALGQLAERCGLYPSTVSRLAASLAHGGLLRRTSDGLWALGPAIPRLAALHAADAELEDLALAEMRALVARTQESVALHVRQGDQRRVLLRVDSPQLLRDHVRVGELLPLERGAGGRVLLAFGGASGRQHDQVRRDGYLMITGDRVPGLVGISAPVWRDGGQLVGALTLTVPEPRLQPEFVTALREAAARLTAQLGGNASRAGDRSGA